MTEEQVRGIVKSWNDGINNFITKELPLKLGYAEGTTEIPMMDWFRAQRIISAQRFYETGFEIQKALRNEGFDVKMDMQSNRLVYKDLW